MSTPTKEATITISGEGSPSPNHGPPEHCRRKMRKVCCCLTFLLVLNLLMTMHISHDLCRIAHMFWSEDVIVMPGGQKTFCNDFCVDMCINDGDNFQCDVLSCLNRCNSHFGVDRDEIVVQGDVVKEPWPIVDSDVDEPLPPPPRDDEQLQDYDDVEEGEPIIEAQPVPVPRALP
eukprot:CAMPEP_0202726212 /NCGR_PEP_ID=MMETSP1385-20130828/184496_1 /ASSEMBLY_ACC=CAM_ASM_000861 /TAXON_ID=933848 /ORGANISM="Elphidium margaritaceum" /LENGTH=174 /DNA_ID=CAMNT_0049392427 /DNA_START=77 /DNA_END=601 /DNA_ORIENTATION=+